MDAALDRVDVEVGVREAALRFEPALEGLAVELRLDVDRPLPAVEHRHTGKSPDRTASRTSSMPSAGSRLPAGGARGEQVQEAEAARCARAWRSLRRASSGWASESDGGVGHAVRRHDREDVLLAVHLAARRGRGAWRRAASPTSAGRRCCRRSRCRSRRRARPRRARRRPTAWPCRCRRCRRRRRTADHAGRARRSVAATCARPVATAAAEAKVVATTGAP